MIVPVRVRFEAWVAVDVSVDDDADLTADDALDDRAVCRAVELATLAQGVEILAMEVEDAA